MLLLLLCECGRCPKIISSKPRKVLLIIAGTLLILAGGPKITCVGCGGGCDGDNSVLP